MATIVIHRSSEYSNLSRDYQLFLDGKKIGTIANGQTKEFKTTAGQHSLVAKIDWCSSPEISVKLTDDERKELTVGGFKNANWIAPVAVGIFILYFFLEHTYRFKYGFLLFIPLFILLFYYITAGRKKYLTFTEI